MDPATLAQYATALLSPVLPFLISEGGKAAAEKGKEVFEDILYEKAIEKIGSESFNRAQALMKKISPKMGKSLEKAFRKVAGNSEDPEAKEELQQEILKLLVENPELARDIEYTINFNIENLNLENINQLAVGDYNNLFWLENLSGEALISLIDNLNRRREETANQEILKSYAPSSRPYYSKIEKKFVTQNRKEELKIALEYLEDHRLLLFSGVAGVGKTTLTKALIDLRPITVPEPFWFSFQHNRDANLEEILENLAGYLKCPEIAGFKAEERNAGKADIDRLTDELQNRSLTWLIFDDLSYMLDEDRYFKDPDLDLLFTSLRENTHRAKVIITSRILPYLKNGECLIDELEEQEQEIKGLKMDFAIDYLKANRFEKVDENTLKALVKSVDGHPLCLKLLAGLVKKHTPESILSDLSIYKIN